MKWATALCHRLSPVSRARSYHLLPWGCARKASLTPGFMLTRTSWAKNIWLRLCCSVKSAKSVDGFVKIRNKDPEDALNARDSHLVNH
jgi:hypothetical protein